MTTLPAIAAGSRLSASPRAAAAAALSVPRGAATMVTRGPGFAPTATHAGIARAALAPALARPGRGASVMSTARAVPGAIVTPPTRRPRAGRVIVMATEIQRRPRARDQSGRDDRRPELRDLGAQLQQ